MNGAPRSWVPVAALLTAAGWGANQFVALLPLYRARIPLTADEVAKVFGIYALTIVPSLVSGGPLSDRVGRRPAVVLAALVTLVGNGWLAWGAPTYPRLLVGRFLIGLGSGLLFSAGSAWLLDLDPLESAGRATASMALGFGGGPLFAGLLATWAPEPLLLPYAVQATALLVALLSLTRTRSPLPQFTRSSSTQQASFDRVTFVRGILVAPWIFAFPSIGFLVIPSRLSPGGASPVLVGVVSAITLGTGALVTRAARVSNRGIASGLAAGALGIGFGVLAVSTGFRAVAIVASVFLGAGYGWTMVRTFALIAAVSPPRWRATLIGLTYATAYVGFGAPLLFAHLARSYSPAEALGLFLLVAVGSMAIAAPLHTDAPAPSVRLSTGWGEAVDSSPIC